MLRYMHIACLVKIVKIWQGPQLASCSLTLWAYTRHKGTWKSWNIASI